MSDLGSNLPVPIKPVIVTKAMKLKWLQSLKQEQISRIAHLRQAIEDLLKGKIPEIERQIMAAEQELKNLEDSEKLTAEALDTTATNEVN